MTRSLTVFALVAAGFLALCRPVCGQEAAASPYSGENMPFFPACAGAVLVYEDRDAEGSLLSFTTDSTVSVDGDFSRGRATVLSTVTVPEDTQRVATSVPVIFDGGEVITDVAALMQSSMQDMVLQSMAAAGSVGEDEEAAVAEVIEKMRVQLKFGLGLDGGKNDVACIVVNGNPFTNGHLRLVEYAAERHKYVLVLVVEEEGSDFTFRERGTLRQGHDDEREELAEVLVCPGCRPGKAGEPDQEETYRHECPHGMPQPWKLTGLWIWKWTRVFRQGRGAAFPPPR